MRFIGSLALVTILGVSFAGVRPASAREATARYSAEQITVIMKMRDNGDSLADVARVVGGNRAEVKQAESVEKSRRTSLTSSN